MKQGELNGNQTLYIAYQRKDVEHCDKYEKQTEGKKQRRVHIVFGDYEKKHYGEMWG